MHGSVPIKGKYWKSCWNQLITKFFQILETWGTNGYASLPVLKPQPHWSFWWDKHRTGANFIWHLCWREIKSWVQSCSLSKQYTCSSMILLITSKLSTKSSCLCIKIGMLQVQILENDHYIEIMIQIKLEDAKWSEPQFAKIVLKTCASSKGLDQPVHLFDLIRGLAVGTYMYHKWPLKILQAQSFWLWNFQGPFMV